MATKVAINGYGRIGRLVFRAMYNDPDVEVVCVNDPGKIEAAAVLTKYDSTQGIAFDSVVPDTQGEYDGLTIDGKFFKFVHDRNPLNLPWKELDVDVVVESTGVFKTYEKAHQHIEAGAKKVLITAPATDEDITIVVGVNEGDYDKEKHNIVSNASCTTNCLAPFAMVLSREFGIKRGLMNTIHAYTGDQKILDAAHKDLRRARAGALSIIPTSTGAAKAVAKVLPELQGKFDGFATRVPTPTGSLVDLTVELEQEVTVEEVNAAMKKYAEGQLKGILEYTEDPIVSCDIIHNPHSSIFDAQLTKVLNGKSNFVKCIAWYDNEWGYSMRVVDLAKMMF